ncbi:MAG: DUF3710 domain-containing protein [Nocardioides marinisabuli]|uniref:DUF3710 domain-containing protein n=1 Tax=Nocardioides marinisabuli TaxID=419476 RepID=UPI00321B0DC2
MKFRRKSDATEPAGADEASKETPEAAPEGPFDAADLPEVPEGLQRIDLGSLLVVAPEGLELRLQVDEATEQIQAVLLAGADGALELRAFAAPRGGDLWGDVRPQIAADMVQRGGTATEQEGRYGTELLCELTRTMPDGRTGKQLSRIVGVNGNRWMLRATLIGAPARGTDIAEPWLSALSQVGVERGQGAMPVGEALDLVMPEGARRVGPAVPPGTKDARGRTTEDPHFGHDHD